MPLDAFEDVAGQFGRLALCLADDGAKHNAGWADMALEIRGLFKESAGSRSMEGKPFGDQLQTVDFGLPGTGDAIWFTGLNCARRAGPLPIFGREALKSL